MTDPLNDLQVSSDILMTSILQAGVPGVAALDLAITESMPRKIHRDSYRISPIVLPEKVDIETLSRVIVREEYLQPEGTTLTICILHLDHGGTAQGKSETPAASGFDADIGKSRARAKAMDVLWELEGYALRKKRYQVQQGTYP